MPSLFDAKVLSRRIAVLILGAIPFAAQSWIYPEHRQLALLAVQQLDGERRPVFDRLWQLARTGDEKQLCASGAELEQGTAPTCIDWAALSAIAGDHSCSSREMFETARSAPWILAGGGRRRPAQGRPGAHPGGARARIHRQDRGLVGEAQRRVAERGRARPARQCAAHRRHPPAARRPGVRDARGIEPCALPARAPGQPTTSLTDYAALTLARRAPEINAAGVYSYFHLSALQKASRLAAEPQLAPAERAALARAMLADEAFALHFLEDVFAAGHIAGTWGDRSQRQGTHDYYNQNGLEVFTWAGGSQVRRADGRRPHAREDAEVAAQVGANQPRAGAGRRRRAGPARWRLRIRRRRPRRPMPSTSAATTSCRRANRT